MKRDLLLVGLLVFVAASGVGGVLFWQSMQPEDDGKKTIKPNTDPAASLIKKQAPPSVVKKEPVLVSLLKKPEEKKLETKKIEEQPPVREEPTKKVDSPPEKKIEAKVEPKVEAKKNGKPRIFAIDNQIQLNDPDGEYTVEIINGGKTIILAGEIKTLRIAGLNEQSILDATRLDAQEIVFSGHVNRGSKVLLGKGQSLSLKDVNDRSLIDGSMLAAKSIKLSGAVNGNSTIKLHAPGGAIEILGPLNDRAQIEIAAPGGTVLFKNEGDSCINGGVRLTVTARDLDVRGTINGTDTQLDVTLTKDGSLKFRRLNGGVNLSYRKADAGDPELRVERGEVDARAVVTRK